MVDACLRGTCCECSGVLRLVIHESTRPEHYGSGWRMYFTFAIVPCAAIGVVLAIVVNAVLHSATKRNLLEKKLVVATLSGLSAGLLGAYPLGFLCPLLRYLLGSPPPPAGAACIWRSCSGASRGGGCMFSEACALATGDSTDAATERPAPARECAPTAPRPSHAPPPQASRSDPLRRPRRGT